jgi:hypothetical protein
MANCHCQLHLKAMLLLLPSSLLMLLLLLLLGLRVWLLTAAKTLRAAAPQGCCLLLDLAPSVL